MQHLKELDCLQKGSVSTLGYYQDYSFSAEPSQEVKLCFGLQQQRFGPQNKIN